MPDAERDAGLAAGRDRGLRVRDGQRERLLAEHVLAGGGRRFDLRAVARVRRRQHHGIDRLVGEHVLVRRADADVHLRGEVAHRVGLERHAAGEAHQLAVRAERTSSLPHQPSPIIAALSIAPSSCAATSDRDSPARRAALQRMRASRTRVERQAGLGDALHGRIGRVSTSKKPGTGPADQADVRHRHARRHARICRSPCRATDALPSRRAPRRSSGGSICCASARRA